MREDTFIYTRVREEAPLSKHCLQGLILKFCLRLDFFDEDHQDFPTSFGRKHNVLLAF